MFFGYFVYTNTHTHKHTRIYTRARLHERASARAHTHTTYMCMQVMETNATTVKQWIQVTLMQQRLVAAGEKVRTGNDAVATAVQMAQSAYADAAAKITEATKSKQVSCVCVCARVCVS